MAGKEALLGVASALLRIAAVDTMIENFMMGGGGISDSQNESTEAKT